MVHAQTASEAQPHVMHHGTHAGTTADAAVDHAGHAHHMPAAGTRSPVTGTPLDFFTNYGNYMPRTHCLTDQAGNPDWPWIITLLVLLAGVIAGYIKIVWFWRRAYLSVEKQDRNRKLMNLAYIFTWCAVCGYGMSMLIFFWPAYRLLALCLVVLNFFTWKFAFSLGDFKVSLQAKQYQRQLEDELKSRATQLEQEVAERTLELEQSSDQLEVRNRLLTQSERRYNAMVANVPGMVYQFVKSPAGEVTWPFISEGCQRVFGIEPKLAQLEPSLLLDRAHPEDRESLDQSIETSARDLAPWQWEGRVRHMDGSIRWVRGMSQPQRTDHGSIQWDGILMDVTKSHEIEDELEAARAESKKLALVAARTDNAVVITDADGAIEWVNESFKRITGYTMQEAVGRKPGHLLQGPETDQQTVQRIREHIQAGEPVHDQILNYSKDGRPYWLDMEIQPIRDERGAIQHFMAIERDITEQCRQADELARAKEDAESASQAKSQFLANMSHEIRTPLNAIIGFSELLQTESDVDASQRLEWSRTIGKSGKHLLSVVNDVLDISKIESGKMPFESIPVSPHKLLADVVSIMRAQAGERGLTLDLDYQSDIPREVQTDPTRLRQVLMNLLTNAVKFTEAGGIRVRVLLDEQPNPDDPQLVIHVTDTGVGMSKQQLERIFSAFCQADSSTTRKFGGTGLGLAISRHICEQLGGGLTVRSEPGAGSTFTARVRTGPITGVRRVPRGSSEAIGTRSESAAGHDPSRAKALAGRVLLVDDGETNRKLIRVILSRKGMQITEAANGQEALDHVEQGGPFDIILMDMQMPVLDGYGATAELRRRGIQSPIIALTAHALSSDRDKCIHAGCSDYLAKPVNPDTLVATIRQYLPATDPVPQSQPDAATQATHDSPIDQPDTNQPQAAASGESECGLTPLESQLPMDDPEFREIAQMFVESAREKLAQAVTALEEDDAETFCSIVHWFKGSGGSAGYHDVTRRAREIEAQARDQGIAGLKEQIDEVAQLVERAEVGLTQTPQ